MIEIIEVLELPGWPKIHADVFDQILNPALFVATGDVARVRTDRVMPDVGHKP